MYGWENKTDGQLIVELKREPGGQGDVRDALRDEVLARLFKLVNGIDDRVRDIETIVTEERKK
jgi:hypothetical protein